MTLQTFLKDATKNLAAAGIATARLDCLVLLEDVLHTDRTQLLAHDDQVLTDEQIRSLDAAIERRSKHEPLAYIRGKSEFFGRVFSVTSETLEPRPETETLVSMFLEWHKLSKQNRLKVVDVGTGTGAIAITIKLEQASCIVSATELNPKTLAIAKQNAQTLKADVSFFLGDLIEPITLSDEPTVLLCNLPYVPNSHTINQAAMQEPAMAIFGGADGLDLYRKLFVQVDKLETKPIAIFTEALPFQHHGLATIARQHGYIQDRRDDFIQQFSIS